MKPSKKSAGRPRKWSGMSPRERLDQAKAEAQERANKIEDGRLMPVEDHRRICIDSGVRVRIDLMNAGNTLAPFLANVDARSAKILLDDWARQTLTAWGDWADKYSKGTTDEEVHTQ